MRNTFGTALSITLFGESHGEMIGVVLDGLPAGFPIDISRIQADLDKRKPKGKTGTARHEADDVHFVSGYFEGRTTGTPLTILIANTNTRSQDYAQLKNRLRPGHADWTAWQKYDGFQDYRGGGHFSGRLTAPIVAAGSIAMQILESFGIYTGSHILQLHDVFDTPFASDPDTLKEQIVQVNSAYMAVLDEQAACSMQQTIEAAALDKDSVGGILEGAITGLPAGIGEPFFDSVESVLSHLFFAIPGCKGVSFGEGFGFADLFGSQANDPLCMNDGQIVTSSNHNGGINGGITNGMPVTFRVVMKPTASIFKPQLSVDWEKKEDVQLTIKGRHDPAIIHRARIVLNSMAALGILDLWIQRLGVQVLQERFGQMPRHASTEQ